MPVESIEVRPSKNPRQVLTSRGEPLEVPDAWSLLLTGDAALSRRIKKDGPTWTMIEMKGRKRFSRGIWAPADRIEALRAELEIERDDPSYQKKLDAGTVSVVRSVGGKVPVAKNRRPPGGKLPCRLDCSGNEPLTEWSR